MRRTLILMLALSVLVAAAMGAPAAALDPSGVAVKVDRAVNASGPGSDRVLEVQGAIFMGDEIVSNASGLAQVRFVDDTRIVIGPNSRLRIDAFVLNPDRTAREVTVSALKGFFRFISGRSASSVYSIRTPTVAIGVRGTVLDVNVRGPDSSVVFHQGAGELCDSLAVCVPIIADCTMLVAPAGGGFVTPTGQEKRQRLSVFFPFVVSQSQLDPAFRADTSACGNLRNIAPQGGASGDGTTAPGPGGAGGEGGSDNEGGGRQ